MPDIIADSVPAYPYGAAVSTSFHSRDTVAPHRIPRRRQNGSGRSSSGQLQAHGAARIPLHAVANADARAAPLATVGGDEAFMLREWRNIGRSEGDEDPFSAWDRGIRASGTGLAPFSHCGGGLGERVVVTGGLGAGLNGRAREEPSRPPRNARPPSLPRQRPGARPQPGSINP